MEKEKRWTLTPVLYPRRLRRQIDTKYFGHITQHSRRHPRSAVPLRASLVLYREPWFVCQASPVNHLNVSTGRDN